MASKQTDCPSNESKNSSAPTEQTLGQGVAGSKELNGNQLIGKTVSDRTEFGSKDTNRNHPMDKTVADRTGTGSRVQFDASVKDNSVSHGDGQKAKRKKKRSFKEIVLEEVLASMDYDGTQVPPKGILKVRSEPLLPGEEENNDKSSHSFVNKAYEGDADTADETASSGDDSKPTLKKAFSKAGLGSAGFADVVGLIIQRSSLDMDGRDAHPFGRDCSIEGILQASRPKSHSKNSAFSKLVVWMTLMSILMGMACGIIFLSETYNATQRESARLQRENGTGNQ